MPKTRISCPNCRQSITADIEQLFDVGMDPTVKQRFLSGIINIIQCPNCGYQGNLATPIVYHDPSKELLLTYFPAELGLPINEQEKMIGPMITKATNNLPQEKRKAYLLRPQTMLTLQSMVERVLEADGITKEMLKAQQERLNLIQRLASATSSDVVAGITAQEDSSIDGEFFTLLSRLIEASLASGDQESAKRLNALQTQLLPITTFGRKVQEQNKEVEAAVLSLQEIGSNMTREQLLDLIIKAPNDLQLSVLVSLARQGMDYQFFQLLSEKIDRATGDTKIRYTELRDNLLDMTRAADKQLADRITRARQFLDALLGTQDIRQATIQNLQGIDEIFIQVFNESMDDARKKGDLDRLGKLSKIQEVLNEASAPSPEIELIQKLLEASNEDELVKMLKEHKGELTGEFLEILTQLIARSQEEDEPELNLRMQTLYRMVLRMSMEANL